MEELTTEIIVLDEARDPIATLKRTDIDYESYKETRYEMNRRNVEALLKNGVTEDAINAIAQHITSIEKEMQWVKKICQNSYS